MIRNMYKKSTASCLKKAGRKSLFFGFLAFGLMMASQSKFYGQSFTSPLVTFEQSSKNAEQSSQPGPGPSPGNPRRPYGPDNRRTTCLSWA